MLSLECSREGDLARCFGLPCEWRRKGGGVLAGLPVPEREGRTDSWPGRLLQFSYDSGWLLLLTVLLQLRLPAAADADAAGDSLLVHRHSERGLVRRFSGMAARERCVAAADVCPT